MTVVHLVSIQQQFGSRGFWLFGLNFPDNVILEHAPNYRGQALDEYCSRLVGSSDTFPRVLVTCACHPGQHSMCRSGSQALEFFKLTYSRAVSRFEEVCADHGCRVVD